MSKSVFELYDEFQECGYVLHECPKCYNECEPTEVDSHEAFCSVCDKIVDVPELVEMVFQKLS